MTMTQNRPIAYAQLAHDEQELVDLAWQMSERAYIPYSQFPVGAAILGENAQGETRVFGGCNVENASYGACICAERTAACKAVSEGYQKFLKVAVVCAERPGGSPCGICRQFLREFGLQAVILCVQDRDNNVMRYGLDELLPDSFGPDSL